MKILISTMMLLFIFVTNLTFAKESAKGLYRYTPKTSIKEKFNVLIGTAFNEATKSVIIFHNGFENKTVMVHLCNPTSEINCENIKKNATNDLYLQSLKLNDYYLVISGQNLNKHEFEQVFNDIKINLKKINKVSFLNNLLPKKANAQSISKNETCNIRRQYNEGNSIEQIKNHIQNSTFTDLTLGCLKGALVGVWDATGGAVVDLSKTAWHLVTSPIETVSSGYQTFKSMINAIAHLDKTLTGFGDYFSKLNNEAKAKMVCSFLSSIGTGILISFLTAGATSPALVAQFTQYLGRFQKVVKLLELVQKTGRLAQVFPQKFFDMMAEGKIAEKVLTRIEKFSNKNMAELAEASVACAI